MPEATRWNQTFSVGSKAGLRLWSSPVLGLNHPAVVSKSSSTGISARRCDPERERGWCGVLTLRSPPEGPPTCKVLFTLDCFWTTRPEEHLFGEPQAGTAEFLLPGMPLVEAPRS